KTRLTRALHKASTLSRNDWGVLAGALGLLPAVNVGLRLVGLRRMIALGEALAAASRRRGEGEPRDVARTAWLVEIAGRFCLPRPTCLAKALVVFSLLRRRGRAPRPGRRGLLDRRADRPWASHLSHDAGVACREAAAVRRERSTVPCSRRTGRQPRGARRIAASRGCPSSDGHRRGARAAVLCPLGPGLRHPNRR